MTGSHDKPMSRDNEDNLLVEENADLEIIEMEEKSQELAVKKQPSHDKQRTTGKLYLMCLFKSFHLRI